MSTEFSLSQTWEMGQRVAYDEQDQYDPNLQIANATVSMSRCDTSDRTSSTSSYDYTPSPDSPFMTSSYHSHTHGADGSSPERYAINSPYASPTRDPTGDYYPTKIKDEPLYGDSAIYSDVTMTSSHLDPDDHLPSTLDDIKPDICGLPPLTPEDTCLYLKSLTDNVFNTGLEKPESEIPEEARCLYQNYHLPPISTYVNRRARDYDLSSSLYSDPESGYCDSSDSSPDTPPPYPIPVNACYQNPRLVPGPDGLFHERDNFVYHHDDAGYTSDDYEDYKTTRVYHKRKMHRGQGRNNKLLWQFMVELMVDPQYRHLADWVDRDEGVFRIIQSSKVADLWGKEKGNTEMNYEKMSRALRFLRTHDYFEMPPKAHYKRLHFKFGPKIKKLVQRKLNKKSYRRS